MSYEMRYPVKFDKEGDAYNVSFPDIPEALTFGYSLGEAEAMAADCLAEALAGRMNHREPIPAPSKGKRMVPVPTYIAAKALLYQAMRDQNISNVALAKRMGVDEKVIRQLLDPKRHGTSLALVDQAFRALNSPLVLSIAKRPPAKQLTKDAARRRIAK